MSESLPFNTASTADGRLCELFEALGPVKGGKLFRGRLSGAAGFSKIVAIKMVDQAGADKNELAQRLRDEARLLAFLKHRSIVTVDDLVQVAGRWVVVMEFVDGRDLAALMAKGPMPPRVVAEIGAEIASALAEAHDARDPQTEQPLGLVHRNVTPSNIRVTPAGEVKLVGFGFARARFSGREAQTGYLAFDQAGFLAPERLLGQDTASSDVYGLGASLASALLGENIRSLSPIAASHAAGVAEIRGRLAGRLSEPGLAPLVDTIVRALVYAPEARPTARALEAELRERANALEGPSLRRWALDNVVAYAPPPPPPVVPPASGPGTAGIVADQLEIARGRPQPAPSRSSASKTPAPKTPAPKTPAPRTAAPKSALPRAERPEAGLSQGKRVAIIAVLGAAALTFLLGGALLLVLAITLGR